MTSFANLGLDITDVQADLDDLGVDYSDYYDPTTMTYPELASLMLVSNLALKQAIFDSSENVEELLFEYAYQADLLVSMQSTFDRLQETIAVDNAKTTALIDFLEGEDTYLDVGDASLIEIDYDWSYTDGGTTYTLETFETLLDFISAVANNETVDYSADADVSGSTTALEFGYAVGEAAGLFYSIVNDSGIAAVPGQFDVYWNNFIGGGDYYIQIDGDIPTFLDLDGFKQYLIAGALQEAGYIGDDVKLDPYLFARTDLSFAFYPDSDDWAKWLQLYFGETKITFDADAGSISMTHTGAAALREMGISLEDYFESAEQIKANGHADDDYFLYAVEGLPSPMNEESATWFQAITFCYTYSYLDTIFDLSSYDDGGVGFSFNYNRWSTLKSEVLTAAFHYERGDSSDEFASEYRDSTTFLDSDTLDDLLEDVGTALQSQSSTGELALVEASTAITEWSELHAGWDTAHKYITDALETAIRRMK